MYIISFIIIIPRVPLVGSPYHLLGASSYPQSSILIFVPLVALDPMYPLPYPISAFVSPRVINKDIVSCLSMSLRMLARMHPESRICKNDIEVVPHNVGLIVSSRQDLKENDRVKDNISEY